METGSPVRKRVHDSQQRQPEIQSEMIESLDLVLGTAVRNDERSRLNVSYLLLRFDVGIFGNLLILCHFFANKFTKFCWTHRGSFDSFAVICILNFRILH